MSVFLDYASTTPFDKEILDTVVKTVDDFGNPSSTHKLGKKAKSQLELYRGKIARLIGAKPSEIVITSGATEANNLAIKGTVMRHQNPHIITTRVEHSSVKTTIEGLEDRCEVTYLDVDENGHIQVEDLISSIKDNTVLVSVILVNNETGVIQDITKVKEALSDTEVKLHVDAVQSLGHVDIDVEELGADFLSLSGHKIYGPKGIGVLYCKEDTLLSPLITGGNHESGRRAGTENNMWVAAMALALEKAIVEKDSRRNALKHLKELFVAKLNASEIPFEVNGDTNTTDHIVNIYFPWSNVQVLLMALDMKDIYVSGGSACNSGSVKPSHVITAMYDEDRANHSLRFSFSHIMKDNDILEAVQAIKEIYNRLTV